MSTHAIGHNGIDYSQVGQQASRVELERKLSERLGIRIAVENPGTGQERTICVDLRNPQTPQEMTAEQRRKALSILWEECLAANAREENLNNSLELFGGFCDQHKELSTDELEKVGALECPACTGSKLHTEREDRHQEKADLESRIEILTAKNERYMEAEREVFARNPDSSLLEEHEELVARQPLMLREMETALQELADLKQLSARLEQMPPAIRRVDESLAKVRQITKGQRSR
jgi:hypothetical protein